jgi:hypothetical protein
MNIAVRTFAHQRDAAEAEPHQFTESFSGFIFV